jgi:hypothetical protein
MKMLAEKSVRKSKDSVASSTIEIVDIEPDPFGDMSVIVSEVEEMVHFNVSWNRPDGMKIIRPVSSTPDHAGNRASGSCAEDLFGSLSRRELKQKHGSESNDVSVKKHNPADKPSFAHDEYMTFSTPRKRQLAPYKRQSWRPTFSLSSSSKTR